MIKISQMSVDRYVIFVLLVTVFTRTYIDETIWYDRITTVDTFFTLY